MSSSPYFSVGGFGEDDFSKAWQTCVSSHWDILSGSCQSTKVPAVLIQWSRCQNCSVWGDTFVQSFSSLRKPFHFVLNYMFECVSVCVGGGKYACECSAHGGQKRKADPLELNLQAVVSHLWVLGIQLRSSARASSALTAEPALPPQELIFKW